MNSIQNGYPMYNPYSSQYIQNEFISYNPLEHSNDYQLIPSNTSNPVLLNNKATTPYDYSLSNYQSQSTNEFFFKSKQNNNNIPAGIRLFPLQERLNGINICRVLKLEYLDDNMDIDYLKQIFAEFISDIIDIRINRDCVACVDLPISQNSSILAPSYVWKNSAFIEFETRGQAANFLYIFHDKILPYSSQFRYMNLSWAPRKILNQHNNLPEDSTMYEYIPVDEITLYVSNIDVNITTDRFRAIFYEKYPSVSAVKLCHTVSPSGDLVPKSSGIVRFLDYSQAERCIAEMNGFVVGSLPISITYAKLSYRTAPGTVLNSRTNYIYPYILAQRNNNINCEKNENIVYQNKSLIPVTNQGKQLLSMNNISDSSDNENSNLIQNDKYSELLSLFNSKDDLFSGLSCINKSGVASPDISYELLDVSSLKVNYDNSSVGIQYSIEYRQSTDVTFEYNNVFGQSFNNSFDKN